MNEQPDGTHISSTTHWNVYQVIAWIMLRDIEKTMLYADAAEGTSMSEEGKPFGYAIYLQDPDASREATGHLMDALRSGKISATGLRDGVEQRTLIPASLWLDLSLNHYPTQAAGEGLLRWDLPTWHRLRFSGDEVMAAWPTRDSTQNAPVEGVDIFRTGAQGRPTAAHVVKREARRQIDAGEFIPETQKAWAEQLLQWLEERYPDAPKFSPKTIGGIIASLHRGFLARAATGDRSEK